MTKKEIKEQIIYYQQALDRAVKRDDWIIIKEAASHINDLSFLILSREDKEPKLVEAVNNSASLHQAECPICGRPFSREDNEGVHYCSWCKAAVHYKAFTPKEIAESLIDEGE